MADAEEEIMFSPLTSFAAADSSFNGALIISDRFESNTYNVSAFLEPDLYLT